MDKIYPNCEIDNIPTTLEKVSPDDEAKIEEETEEEHAVRLQRISDEIKADMKAGRYKHGKLHPEISAKNQSQKEVINLPSIVKDMSLEHVGYKHMMHGTLSGRYTHKQPTLYEFYNSKTEMAIMDEYHHIRQHKTHLNDYPDKEGYERDGPKKIYWNQPIPKKRTETPPSKDKRTKLRKKRKERK